MVFEHQAEHGSQWTTILSVAESEPARLQGEQATNPVERIAPEIRRRYAAMLTRLDQVLMADPECGREELRGTLGERITLQPDKSGSFLWAEYSLGVAPLLPNAGASAEIMVAGARF
jgi:hypothetical protein